MSNFLNSPGQMTQDEYDSYREFCENLNGSGYGKEPKLGWKCPYCKTMVRGSRVCGVCKATIDSPVYGGEGGVMGCTSCGSNNSMMYCSDCIEDAIVPFRAEVVRLQNEITDAKALAFNSTVPRTVDDTKDTLDEQLDLQIQRFGAMLDSLRAALAAARLDNITQGELLVEVRKDRQKAMDDLTTAESKLRDIENWATNSSALGVSLRAVSEIRVILDRKE